MADGLVILTEAPVNLMENAPFDILSPTPQWIRDVLIGEIVERVGTAGNTGLERFAEDAVELVAGVG